MVTFTSDAAEFIANLRFSMEQSLEIPKQWCPQDQATAYEIQSGVVERLLEKKGGTRVGYKVACTNTLAQELLGTESPFYGYLLSPFVHSAPAQLNSNDFSMRIIEAEFAFEMDRDLPAKPTEYTREEVAAEVRNIFPAIEIVDTRFTDWTAVGALQLIADNACNGAWVCGNPSSVDWRKLDLATQPVQLIVNGETLLEGSGNAVLGHPLNPLTWLVNKLGKKGQGLKAGDLITTGVCTDVYSAAPGDEIVADFGIIGQAKLSFSQ